jgi:hypothetical protein
MDSIICSAQSSQLISGNPQVTDSPQTVRRIPWTGSPQDPAGCGDLEMLYPLGYQAEKGTRYGSDMALS